MISEVRVCSRLARACTALMRSWSNLTVTVCAGFRPTVRGRPTEWKVAPGKPARTSGRQGPFATTAAMSALVAACGVTDVDCHDEPLSVVLPDAAAWRAWTNTLGLKAVWDAVPSDQLDDVMEQISDALEADRNEDGALHLTQQVRYATGRVL